MGLHLLLKLDGIGQRRQRVGVGLGQELHFTGVGEFLEQVDKLGNILLTLLEGDAGDRDRATELAF